MTVSMKCVRMSIHVCILLGFFFSALMYTDLEIVNNVYTEKC